MSLITAKREFAKASQGLIKATNPTNLDVHFVFFTLSKLLSEYAGFPVNISVEMDDAPADSISPTESDLEK